MREIQHNNAGWDCFRTLAFAGDLEGLKINLGRTCVHIWKSYIRTNKLDVQETNISPRRAQRKL